MSKKQIYLQSNSPKQEISALNAIKVNNKDRTKTLMMAIPVNCLYCFYCQLRTDLPAGCFFNVKSKIWRRSPICSCSITKDFTKI